MTKQKRSVLETFGVTESTTEVARVLAAVFLSDYVTRKTEHAGKLKPFEQRAELSGYVTRKTEHGGRLKPPHPPKLPPQIIHVDWVFISYSIA